MFKVLPMIYREGPNDGAGGGGSDSGAGGGGGQNAPWHTGLDPELVGHAQTHGWADLDPAKAAAEVIKAHHHAKKLIGLPPEQLLRMPKDANDAAGWSAVWDKLGVPKEAKDYDFSAVKHKNDAAIADGLAGLLRTTASQLKLTKDAAVGVGRAMVNFLDGRDEAERADKTAKLTAEKEALKANWAEAPEVFMLQAQGAARRLGVSDAEVTALESVIGYARVMEMFRTVGAKIGEAPYLSVPNGGGGSGPMTFEAAQARKSELMADASWVKAYTSGDADKRKEMDSLNTIIARR